MHEKGAARQLSLLLVKFVAMCRRACTLWAINTQRLCLGDPECLTATLRLWGRRARRLCAELWCRVEAGCLELLLPWLAPSAQLHLMRIRTTMRHTQENNNKWTFAVPLALKTQACILFAYLLNRAVAEKQVTSMCSLFSFLFFACVSSSSVLDG